MVGEAGLEPTTPGLEEGWSPGPGRAVFSIACHSVALSAITQAATYWRLLWGVPPISPTVVDSVLKGCPLSAAS